MNAPTPRSLAVIGAGPVGLEAAAAALEAGFDVHVFERGEVGAHPLAWGHVRMFTPWRANVGPASARLLARNGWTPPEPETCPSGAELAATLLAPLAACPELKGRIHEHSHVAHVSRRGRRRGEGLADGSRRSAPFRLLVRDAGGRENFLHAFAVIDASGVYGTPNRAGTGGIPARGETYLAPQMTVRCDDVAGLRRARHAGRRTLVIGGGASAATTVLALAGLAAEVPGTTVAWATRAAGGPFAGERENDPLPARAALHAAAHALRDGSDPAVTGIGGAEVEGFEFNSATHRYRVALAQDGRTRIEEVDEVVINTGFSADDSIHRELDVRLPDGEASAEPLEQVEPDYWIVGAKSAARASDVRLEKGYAQVAAVVARLSAAFPA